MFLAFRLNTIFVHFVYIGGLKSPGNSQPVNLWGFRDLVTILDFNDDDEFWQFVSNCLDHNSL